jgi:hypothetical protein
MLFQVVPRSWLSSSSLLLLVASSHCASLGCIRYLMESEAHGNGRRGEESKEDGTHFLRPGVVLVENVLKRSVVACIVPEKEMKNPTALSTCDKYLAKG